MDLLKDPLSNFTSKLLYPSYSFGIEYLKKTNDTMTGHYDTFANMSNFGAHLYPNILKIIKKNSKIIQSRFQNQAKWVKKSKPHLQDKPWVPRDLKTLLTLQFH